MKPSVPSRPLTPSPPFRRGGGAEITFDYLSFNGSLMDFNGGYNEDLMDFNGGYNEELMAINGETKTRN